MNLQVTRRLYDLPGWQCGLPNLRATSNLDLLTNSVAPEGFLVRFSLHKTLIYLPKFHGFSRGLPANEFQDVFCCSVNML